MFIPNLLGFVDISLGMGGGGGNATLLEPEAEWMGDSISAATGASSIADWTNFFLNGRLVSILGYNQGVSGNQTAQMLARQSVGLALNPKLYNILAGTNDIVVGGRSAADIIINLQALIDNALATASVALVCIRTILKRSDSSFLGNPNFEITRNAVNNWIRSLSDPRVFVVDYDLSLFDPTVHTNDGLHPNNYGAMLLGEFTANGLGPRLDQIDVLANQTGNMVNNPQMTGTTGGKTGATGDVATGYQVRNFMAANGLTVVCSKGVIDGSNFSQVMTVNGTTTATGFIQLRNVTNYSGLAGEQFEALMTVKIENGSGLEGITVSGDGVITFGGGTVTIPLNRNFDGVVRHGRSTLSADDTMNVQDVNFSFRSGEVISNMILTVSRPIWRKIA